MIGSPSDIGGLWLVSPILFHQEEYRSYIRRVVLSLLSVYTGPSLFLGPLGEQNVPISCGGGKNVPPLLCSNVEGTGDRTPDPSRGHGDRIRVVQGVCSVCIVPLTPKIRTLKHNAYA